MKTTSEMAWEYYQDQRIQGMDFHHQRSNIAGLVVASVSILAGVLAIVMNSASFMLIGLFLFFLGLYGTIMTKKLYERSEYHFGRGRICLKYVDDELFTKIKKEAESVHNRAHPMLSRMPNHWFWMTLHVSIMLMGFTLVVGSFLI